MVELGEALRSQCLPLADYGIKFAIDIESARLLQNLDYLRPPFARAVITKPHILHPGYERSLDRLFVHADKHSIETVVSDISSLDMLQKAKSAGFGYVRPQLLKSKSKDSSKP